jgi:uncharacterized protein YaaN involved in tellurite resistance
MVQELTPPQVLEAPLQLAPPEPVNTVEPQQSDDMIRLDNPTVQKLDGKVKEFVDIVVNSDVHSEQFTDRLTAVHNLGNKEIRAAASVSNRMLDRPVKAMDSGFFDSGSPISQSLVDLRKTVEELDPSRQGDLFSPAKLLEKLPFGSKVRNYFLKYQSSQAHLNAIINALYRGQDELRKDNATIEQEKMNLWTLMQQLRQYVYVGKKIDAALEDRIAIIEATDPEKARIVREEMQFYVRQKVQDLLTQLAVSIQGYLALDMLRKNNLELIKGVDRATTTTVSALRTAVIVAQALVNQKLVLDQITALNTTTSNLIEATSQMLKKQSAQIYEQAASSTINIQQLQNAFSNIYQAMDMMENYKVEALKNMQITVNLLSEEVDKANSYIDRVRAERAAEATRSVDLSVPDGEIRL